MSPDYPLIENNYTDYTNAKKKICLDTTNQDYTIIHSLIPLNLTQYIIAY